MDNAKLIACHAGFAAQRVGRELIFANVDSEAGFEAAIAKIKDSNAVGLAVPSLPLFSSGHNKIASIVNRNRIPAIYSPGDAAERDGLMSYGPILPDLFRQLGVYSGKILAGTKAGDLPIAQPARVVLTIISKLPVRFDLPFRTRCCSERTRSLNDGVNHRTTAKPTCR